MIKMIRGLFWYSVEYISIGGLYVGISFYNAIVELYVAIRSILTGIYWIATGCTEEITVETEDGEIIHHFPQINRR